MIRKKIYFENLECFVVRFFSLCDRLRLCWSLGDENELDLNRFQSDSNPTRSNIQLARLFPIEFDCFPDLKRI